MNQEHIKHLDAICDEWAKACKKHPNFADNFTTKSNLFVVQRALKNLRIENAEPPYDADRILYEEIAEAIEAYMQGDKDHCIQELAQCGAVILRMMDFVENKM